MPDFAHILQNALGDAYRIEREIPGGGMSRLFLATDTSLGRSVAVKVLPPELASGVNVARFRREIEVTSQLQHPHILPILAAGTREDLVYYVMPFVAGESLADRLRRERQLPVGEAVRIASDVARALDHAHRRGVLHRDIKPGNILLQDGQAVVADFGIARAIAEASGGRLTATGLALGTALYMSPEQSGGETLDARSDVYSLGCVLYEMLMGEPPFTGPTAQVILARRLSQPLPGLRAVREGVPEALERVVHTALARAPADRFADAAAFAAALEQAVTAPARVAMPGAKPRAWMRRASPWLIVPAVLGLGVAGLLLSRSERGGGLDADLIAIAPFDVLGPGLELWREGMVDVLARNLDGAGPLRTVPPTVVMRRWSGRADRATAADLARRSGARMALFGSLTTLGADSVRLRATLLDAASERIMGEADLRDAIAQVDRLADTLSISLLRDLGRVRPVGAARQTALGSRSLPAIKAFLQGEYHYRRAAMDSAQLHYERAIAADTTFALALHRLGYARSWEEGGNGPSVVSLRLRAANLNRGLAPRDSLVLLADSLHVAALLETTDSGTWYYTHRALAALEAATRAYPEDPQLWCAAGEIHHHLNLFERTTLPRALDSFARCIALDSLNLPVYGHAAQFAVSLGDTAAARRYARTFLAIQPAGQLSTEIRLYDALLEPGAAVSMASDPRVTEAPSLELHAAVGAFQFYADSAEIGIALAKQWVDRRDGGNPPHRRLHWAAALAYRGHLADGYALRAADSTFYAELAFLGGVPEEDARAEFDVWLGAGAQATRLALPWWAARADTASVGRFVRVLERRTASLPAGSLGLAFAARDLEVGRAHLALARHDTTEALRRLEALPDSLCTVECEMWLLTRARLTAARGRDADALNLLEPGYRGVASPVAPVFALERARVADRLGQRATAARAYALVADAWRNADPGLQPLVAEARRGLERMAAERE